MYFEFTLADLKEVKSNLKKIERNVSSRKSSMENGLTTVDESTSLYKESLTLSVEKQIETCDSVLDMVDVFEIRVQEIIDAIEDTEAVENENVTFIYDSEVLDMWIANIKEVLSAYNPDYKAIFTLSENYTGWESGVTSKLDNTEQIFADGILEEAKQRDDEKVFRHNRSIMQGLELKLREVISNDFVDQLDNIDDIKEKLDGLFVLDEISDIRDIILENVKVGSAPNAKELDNVMDMEEVTVTNVKNIVNEYLENQLPAEVLDFLSNMQKYGGVTLQGSEHAVAELLDNLKFIEVNSTGVNKWKISSTLDSFEDWAKEDPDSFNHLFNGLLDEGMEGLYRYDPEMNRWYSIEKGQKKWYNKLPESVSKGTEKGLLALGFAIDGYTVLDGIQNNDYSQVGKGLGSIIGGVIALGACSFLTLEGVALVGMEFIIGFGLSTFGAEKGEDIGEKREIASLENALSESGIEVIWE